MVSMTVSTALGSNSRPMRRTFLPGAAASYAGAESRQKRLQSMNRLSLHTVCAATQKELRKLYGRVHLGNECDEQRH